MGETQHAGSMEPVRGSRPFCSLSKRSEGEREGERERRCRVPTQASYSSSETLQAVEEPGARLLLGARAPPPPSRETLEHSRPGETPGHSLLKHLP